MPIIFSGPMIRALLDGRKTMTRRLLYSKRKARNGFIPSSATFLRDHPPPCPPLGPSGFPTDNAPDEFYTLSLWQRVKPGDRLWVRERAAHRPYKDGEQIIYHCELPLALNRDGQPLRWHPSIHMPRAWSRLTLVVTATKIEPLQNITEADAKAEGVERAIAGIDAHGNLCTYRTGFVYLWGQLHGTESWLENPKVVALTFEVHKMNIDAMPKVQAA